MFHLTDEKKLIWKNKGWGTQIDIMESLKNMINWLFDIKHLVPEQIYIVAMNHLKSINDELEEKVETRCTAINWNGNRCRQEGMPNQTGGPIINGRCKYHRKVE